MFWRKKKPSGPATVGCFGKIPATGDFIRHNAGGDELAAFDRWMGAGMDATQRGLGPGFEAAYQRSVGLFIFRGDPKGDELPQRGLVGAWAASGDNAGRHYPMVVFASYDYSQLCAAGPALPVALWRFFTSAYELATQGRAWTVDRFIERVQRLELPPLEDPVAAGASYTRWLGDNSMKALWETGFGSDASRFWVMSNVVESVSPFKGQELPTAGLALRLPVGAGDAYATAVWLDMIQRVCAFKSTLLNTFWTPQQTALIHVGPPQPGSLREIIAPTGAAEHVAELCGIPTCDEPTARARLRKDLDGAVSLTDQPISQFLRALG